MTPLHGKSRLTGQCFSLQLKYPVVCQVSTFDKDDDLHISLISRLPIGRPTSTPHGDRFGTGLQVTSMWSTIVWESSIGCGATFEYLYFPFVDPGCQKIFVTLTYKKFGSYSILSPDRLPKLSSLLSTLLPIPVFANFGFLACPPGKTLAQAVSQFSTTTEMCIPELLKKARDGLFCFFWVNC